MAIVRELLVGLGFQLDRNSVNTANRAVTGFRTRFALLGTAAAFAFSKIASFFGNLSTANLDAAELSKTLGLSLKELIAIQMAAQKVGRLNFSQTNAAFSQLNKMLNNFKGGVDTTLSKIARDLKFEVDSNGGPKKLFDQILSSLNQIQNEQEKIRISSNIFGDELGPKIAALSASIDAFKSSTAGFQDIGSEVEKQLPEFKKYEDSINRITESWTRFTFSLSNYVLPVLQSFLNYLTNITNLIGGLANFDGSVIKSSLNAISSGLDSAFEFTGLDKVSNFFKRTFFDGESLLNRVDANTVPKILDYVNNPSGYKYDGFLSPISGYSPMTFNNNVEINVPSGTSEEMTSYLSEDINRQFQEAVQKVFNQIQSNNPQVE